MKICFKCNIEQPLDAFYKHSMMADGHLNKCKKCAKSDVRRHRQNNESVREYDRRRSKEPARIAHVQRVVQRFRERFPEKYKAHTAVNNAVRDGRLRKPKRCSKCKSMSRLHGHHADYSKPLDVEWLCARCHAVELRVYE